ncbi:polycystin-1-like protein 2 isoform X2 [Ambystoma mexicanum]|uniref:polycystin-1-like protein 2 isoform X2 n=1 Tax=Ambystoma mexicanum TaxID=8296 RepID=UPI0037E86AD3
MCLPFVLLCALALVATGDSAAVGAQCPQYQVAFNHSCFEFVKLERTFPSAQSWCERGGGHLVFIDDHGTQEFVQTQVLASRDWWIGLAWSYGLNNTAEGSLAWLDNSNISYSNWHKDELPLASSKCGHILKNSGYSWGGTENCSQEFYFICEFESGQTIACDYYNATVQCGSGEVVQISDSTYGRKSPHYCTLDATSSMESMAGCSWTNVKDQVAGQCHGLQACQVSADGATFGEPCPTLGSYLSISYKCMEGLQLMVDEECSMLENVTISLQWLLSPYTGNLSCIINPGDGYNIDYQPLNLSSSVVHMFKAPGEYTIFVECTTSEWHVTAQKTVTVQGSVDGLVIDGCYSQHESMGGDNGSCRTLYGETLWIQVMLRGVRDVTYTVMAGNVTLFGSTEKYGITPHNLTLNRASQQVIGPGIHQLTIIATSNTTVSELSQNLTVHLVEPVAGLKATMANSVVTSGRELQVSVSVAHGAPVELKFEVTGLNVTFHHSKESPGGDTQMFNIPVNAEGTFLLKVLALNAFSNMSMDIGNITVLSNTTPKDSQSSSTSKKDSAEKDGDGKRQRIQISPRRHVDPFTTVTLRWPDSDQFNLTWSCGSCWTRWTECVDQGLIQPGATELRIPSECLPPPSAAVTLTVFARSNGKEDRHDEQCLYVTAKPRLHPKIRCVKNCKPVNVQEDMSFTVSCEGCFGVTYSWYLDNNFPRKVASLPAACSLPGFRQNSLTLLQINASSLTLNSSYLLSQEAAFRIRVTAKTSQDYGEESYVVSTLSALQVPVCAVSPMVGTVLTGFAISCSTCATHPCPVEQGALIYCIYPKPNSQLHCGPSPELAAVYLPLGEEKNNFMLNITVTVQNSFGDTAKATATVTVKPEDSSRSNQTFLETMSDRVNAIQRGENASASLIQLYKSVSSVLNQGHQEDMLHSPLQTETRRELREAMLASLSEVTVTSMETALQMSEALKEITHRSEELSSSAQVEASSTLNDVSMSLLAVSSEEEDGEQRRRDAASYLFNAVNNVLEANVKNTTESSEEQDSTQSMVSQQLLSTVENLQSALLMGKLPDEEPTILTAPSVTMYINRLQADNLDNASVKIANSSSASFSLPSFSSFSMPGETEETVDLRMMSFAVNPFSSSDGFDISGSVGGLSLTSTNGLVIPVNGLKEPVEIILPRPAASQEDTSLLKLGNYTVMQINVTALDASLVIYIEPEEVLPLVLYLGYGYHANESNYDMKTQLPYSQHNGDVLYTWILSPDDLLFGEGTYYLTVHHQLEPEVSKIKNVTLRVTCFISQCVFWDEIYGNWSSSGCHVGPKTTPSSTQCLCTHLTFFGSSFFVMPNAIDVSKTLELFATFVDNPVVVTTVGCIVVLYVLVLIWARRKDIQDNAKVSITVLEDNDPFAQYRYFVTVYTGHRRGAATTSKVTITIYGSEGESDPHHLYDPEKPVFERGGVDIFVLTTLFPLGDLQSVRLWHDNSGDRPSWYVNRVLVHDVALDQKWYFLCNSWLSIDVGECVLDKVFSAATEEDMKQFSNIFFMKTSKGFRDGHIWYSVFSRSPRSPFTRAQRVSCCFSLLLCTMLTSIMFWGVPTDPAEQKMDLGKIEFTWQEVMIGIESSILMFPINLLIVQIFRHIRPRPTTEQKEKKQGKSGRVSPTMSPSRPNTQYAGLTPEAVIKDIRRIANSLFKTMKTPMPPSGLDFGKSTDINKLLALVEDIIRQQNRASQEVCEESKRKDENLILTLGSVDLQEKTRSPTPEKGLSDKLRRIDNNRYLYMQLQHVEKELEVLGPHKFPRSQCYNQAVRQVQHMKTLLENQIFASGSSSERYSPTPSLSGESKKSSSSKGLPWWCVFIGWALIVVTSGVSGFFTMLYGLHYGKDSSIKWLITMGISFFESLFITQPLKVLGFAAFFALVLKKVEPEDEDEAAIEGPLACPAYLGFLWMLLLVAYGQRDPNSYYLNKHLEGSFTDGLQNVYSYQQFFTWANTTLISNLYGHYPGFVTDGNSKLVGTARIRQVRVRKDTCPIANKMKSLLTECHASYSLSAEDTSDYAEHWNLTVADTNSSDLNTAWNYQSQSQLRSHPVWGKLAMYRGGGYVVYLGSHPKNASRVIQYLYSNVWLDTYTRAVFVEFTVYNANVNLFCIIRLAFETNALGAFFTHSELQSVRLYPYTDGLHIFVVAAEVIYFLFIIYYMVIQAKLMKALKWGYFRSKWNILELAVIVISWCALSVFVKRTILGTRDISYYQDHKDECISFDETATADAVLGYLIAFLVLLSTVKLWHLLRLNPKLNMITSTLQRAWGDISGFITVILIMFLAYSIATNLIFGWKLYSYKTVLDSAKTMVSLQLGIFNYEEVLDYNPILGSFLIGSCIIFMTFVVLNLFISVILVAFTEEQKNYQASEEEEIVDLMLMKICSFFGVKYKKEEVPKNEAAPKEECSKRSEPQGGHVQKVTPTCT